MKLKSCIFAMAVVVIALPGTLLAQPGSQPLVFYGEEPWGGSYLGVDTRDVTKDRLASLHLREEAGVEVTMVDADAPAGKAGIKEHDVIQTVNSQPVQSVEQLRRMIREIPPGRTVSVGISRDGQPVTIQAQLAERSKMPGIEHSFNFNMPAIPPINPVINMPEMDLAGPVVVMHSVSRSGLMVESLTPQLGEFFGAKNGNGVLIRSVEKGSRAEQAGFRAGDVVTKVNGNAVGDCSDFTRLLRSRKENKVSITVLRERKEQNLTITLPELRRSGALRSGGCNGEDAEACADLFDFDEDAVLVPEMKTAIITRIQPEIAGAREQIEKEFRGHGDELKKDMEEMRRDIEEHKKEIEIEIKRWSKDSEI